MEDLMLPVQRRVQTEEPLVVLGKIVVQQPTVLVANLIQCPHVVQVE